MRRSIKLLFSSAVIVGSTALAALYVSRPSNGTIHKDSSINAVKGEQTRTIQTSYFTALLTSAMQMKTSNENDGAGVYAQYLYVDPAFGASSQVGITLGHLNSLSFDEVPFVKQRTIQIGAYVAVESGPLKKTFRSITGDEYTTIWLHNNDYVVVAASGPSSKYAELQDIVDSVTRSWQWR